MASPDPGSHRIKLSRPRRVAKGFRSHPAHSYANLMGDIDTATASEVHASRLELQFSGSDDHDRTLD